jgi:hypothetical protein
MSWTAAWAALLTRRAQNGGSIGVQIGAAHFDRLQFQLAYDP